MTQKFVKKLLRTHRSACATPLGSALGLTGVLVHFRYHALQSHSARNRVVAAIIPTKILVEPV